MQTPNKTDVLQLTEDTELRGLVAEIAPETPHLETLSRIIWSHLAEPGDGVAGTLIQTLGAQSALDLVAACRSHTTTTSELTKILGSYIPPELLETITETFTLQQLLEGFSRWAPRLSREPIRAYLRKASQKRIQVVTPHSSSWPAALHDLGYHAPTVLWVRGNPSLLSAPGLAVVGSRAVSSYGIEITHDLTVTAAQAGAAIFSGAALGVDGAAHRAALALQSPTIAVLAGGVDRNYPAAHEEMLQEIEQMGVICAESPPDTVPIKWRFLQRNRIIAALANATLVTAAAYRSGAINTAGHAASLGRPLGAVPGQITSPTAQGCHRIIKELGATPIFSATDLRTLLGIDEQLFTYPAKSPHTAAANHRNNAAPAALSSPELLRLWDVLHPRSYRTVQELAIAAGMDTAQVARSLAELELLELAKTRAHHKTGETVWRRNSTGKEDGTK